MLPLPYLAVMPNRLIHEQSLYLLQHAHNPVDWYPWGDEAFQKAQKENKPVIVSIGYAACHWCHVMERESFEDATVAAFMNKHFINIKVDREEHPEVDHLYMDAVQAIAGNGGWPLNVFVTPERIPFYGGTYFPPRPMYQRLSWLQLLQQMVHVWNDRPQEVQAQSEQMIRYLQNASNIGFQPTNSTIAKTLFDTITTQLLQQSDTVDGGFGAAPKFPHTMAIQYLLEHYHYTGNADSFKQACLSLDKMAAGGIYDHLGGGFARYSTDAQWLAPHFEKMLYDNALLIGVYSTAYRLSPQERYKQVITETIAFIDRELTDTNGLCYSALDADSEGEEGKFYTWDWEQWMAAELPREADEILRQYWGVIPHGNWEGTNILHVATDISTLALTHQKATENLMDIIEKAKEKLRAIRQQRARPATDDKCLLSWNAMLNTAWIQAAKALQDDTYLQKAQTHIDSMLAHFEKEGVLYHVWKNGCANIPANLDDYALLIQALVQVGLATGKTSYMQKAAAYCETVQKEFVQQNGVLFYFTSINNKAIPIRKLELYDGSQPSANSLMAHNLFLLGMCMGKSDWIEHAQHLLQQIQPAIEKHGLSFAYWAILLQRNYYQWKTVVVSGTDASPVMKELEATVLPHVVLLKWVENNSKIPLVESKDFSNETSIFVCSDGVCYPSVKDVATAQKYL